MLLLQFVKILVNIEVCLSKAIVPAIVLLDHLEFFDIFQTKHTYPLPGSQ